MKYSMCSVFIIHTLYLILSCMWRYTFKGFRHSVSFVALFYFTYQYSYWTSVPDYCQSTFEDIIMETITSTATDNAKLLFGILTAELSDASSTEDFIICV